MGRRAVWLTDIHLEFIGRDQLEQFLLTIASHQPDAIWITGDIAQAPSIRLYLTVIVRSLLKPVYFVLGNHDYYHGSIVNVRAEMRALTEQMTGAVWLPATGVVEMTPNVALVGHDGWADGRYGDFLSSTISLNDYGLIKELSHLTPMDRLHQLNSLGDEAAEHLRDVISQAAERYSEVYVLLHPPPFPEVCFYNGRLYSPNSPFLPHFASKAPGDVLLEMAERYPQTSFTVLCGHTHGGGSAQMRPNLLVLNGAAEYRDPVVQRLFEMT